MSTPSSHELGEFHKTRTHKSGLSRENAPDIVLLIRALLLNPAQKLHLDDTSDT